MNSLFHTHFSYISSSSHVSQSLRDPSSLFVSQNAQHRCELVMCVHYVSILVSCSSIQVVTYKVVLTASGFYQVTSAASVWGYTLFTAERSREETTTWQCFQQHFWALGKMFLPISLHPPRWALTLRSGQNQVCLCVYEDKLKDRLKLYGLYLKWNGGCHWFQSW